MNFKILYSALVLIVSLKMIAFAQPERRLEDLLKNAYQNGEFSGALLVAKGDKIIYKGAVGLADRRWKIPNSVDTKFRIGSVTKQFTTLLMMQLVESGKIDLDKTLDNYLPNFPKQFGEKITVSDLLLSSSGLPDFDVPEFYAIEDSEVKNFEYFTKKFLKGDLQFEPGSKFNYNNGDFIVAGAILEEVTGKTFGQNLDERILVPLGMKNTGLIRNDEIVENLASGYEYKDGSYVNEAFYSVENYGSAGAMYSSLDDMYLWDRALIENKLLSKQNTEIMFTPSAKLGFIGLGSWVYELKIADEEAVRLIERQGGIGGFIS
ncbi:MAG: beta-lactamase family protein, partial [Acidobacteria bacterium]|nr:beta-lactamase family protein [Acidobacteriota bacterium]